MANSSNFNTKLKKYLTVYKVPLAPNSLDPTVFYFPDDTSETPILQRGIEAQINNDITHIAGTDASRIVRYVVVGDAVDPSSKDPSKDIKVLVQLNKNIMDVDVDGLLAEEILKLCNVLSGKIAVGSMRKIQYLPTVRPINTNSYEGIYDVFSRQWLKVPSNITK